MEALKLADIRTDYTLATLDEGDVGDNPLAFFNKWLMEAEHAQLTEVNAMTLATVDVDNRPHARIVLLKGIEHESFQFYTNYESHKGRQLSQRRHAALVFFWKELERQVRIEGIVSELSPEESDAYFNSRPKGSRVGAWASPQSSTIASREILEERAQLFEAQYAESEVPRPSHWGGYGLKPLSIEFWQGRKSRMHDRILFERENLESAWEKSRLAP
ncbi:MAG: pyridoxamine 5'-phosphate oxidase [Chitinophagaceae bacterium]